MSPAIRPVQRVRHSKPVQRLDFKKMGRELRSGLNKVTKQDRHPAQVVAMEQ